MPSRRPVAASLLIAFAAAVAAACLPDTPEGGRPGAADLAGPAGVLTSTSTVTPGLTPSATVSATLAVSPTLSATAAPTITEEASAPPNTPATTYVPYAAAGQSHELDSGRVWGLQFTFDEIPVEHRKVVALEMTRPASLGVGSVRTMIRWSAIEPANVGPEGYDWAYTDELLRDYSKNYDVLVSVVDYPAWATVYRCGYDFLPGMEGQWRQFMRALAERYAKPPYRVVGWEISNEVDIKTTVNDDDRKRHPDWGGGQPTVPLGGCFGDRPEAYLRFLRAAREEIKAVSPEKVVTLGGLANVTTVPGFHPEFLEAFLRLGGGDLIDVMNYHWFPDIPTEPSGPSKLRDIVAALARHGHGDLPIWITETYRLTLAADPDSPRRQIEYLIRDMVEIWAEPRVQRMYWFGWQDFPPAYKGKPTDPDRGLVDAAFQAKPALRVLPLAIRQTEGAATDLSTPAYTLYRFAGRRAAEVRYVAWSRSGRTEAVTVPSRAGRVAEAQLFPWESLAGPEGRLPAPILLPARGQEHRLEIGGSPVFITVR